MTEQFYSKGTVARHHWVNAQVHLRLQCWWLRW